MHPIFRDRRSLAIYVFAWLVLGGLLALPIAGPGLALWRTALAITLPLGLVYGFICLSAWYPCRANPIPGSSVGRIFAVLGGGAILSSGLWVVLASGWVAFLDRTGFPGSSELYGRHLLLLLAVGVLLYLLASAFHYLLIGFEASREAEKRSLRLEVLAREAELEAFRTQIDPHFLFNCLNSIASLTGTDPSAARDMAIRLGGFLRTSLELAATDEIPLDQELRLARSFLEVEKVRFGDRLNFEERIDPECTRARVPALVLQPLLENAIKHGISHLVEGGTVVVECDLTGDELLLAVENPCDPERSPEEGSGIGLANVRGRLDLMYPGRTRLDVEKEPNRFRVEIHLPAPASEEQAEGTEELTT